MTKMARNSVKDNKEQIAYVLFYSFLSFFLVSTIFGLLTGSKCLLVSGMFSLFGVFIAVVTMLRIHRSHPGRGAIHQYFNPDKLELIIVLGTSAIITLSTSVLFLSISHLAFFHTLYPPELLAGWVAMITGIASFGLILWTRKKIIDLPEIDEKETGFILNASFLLSVMTMVTVVLARAGALVLDYACAILTAFFLIVYSVKFLRESFQGLMDASCDKKTVASIEAILRKARSGASIKELRVNKAGHVIEIIAVLGMAGDISMREAAMIAQHVKRTFRKKFSSPHELFIGVTEQK